LPDAWRLNHGRPADTTNKITVMQIDTCNLFLFFLALSRRPSVAAATAMDSPSDAGKKSSIRLSNMPPSTGILKAK